MYSSAVSASKSRAPNAYMLAMSGTELSPVICPVYPLATGQRGSQPPSTAELTSDCAMSEARSGASTAWSAPSERYVSQSEKLAYRVRPSATWWICWSNPT
ncbi:hypothetical protein D3C74_355990 [compost metagenome]